MGAIPSLPRASLARITERLIDRMDEIDGDADAELNGDELDCTGSHEEDTPPSRWGQGDGRAGDPDDGEDDDPAGEIAHG